MSTTRSLPRSGVRAGRSLAVVAVLAHFGFSLLVVLGGYLAWIQPWMLWLHLPALAWAIAGLVFNLPCPLTDLESWGRARGGWPPLVSTGFIDHYFTGVIFPASWKSRMPFVVLVVVLTSWLGLLLR